MTKINKKVVAVDLFCGAGGLTHGLEIGGVDVIAGYDFDPAAEYAYTKNNKAKFILKDITKVSSSDILENFEKTNSYKLLAGCAPCQPFSSYTNKIKEKSNKWGLLRHFSRLISEVNPDLVTMENVPNLVAKDVFLEFLSTLEQNNYFYSYKVLSCPDYGVPQARKRLVLLASKLNQIEIVPPTHNKTKYLTVRDAISFLPQIEAGQQDESDPLHMSSRLSDLNLMRIIHSKQGGSWRDWPEHLIANCHKKESGKSFLSVYGRMMWDKPSPTITTQCYGYGNGRFGHPVQNRGLSLREAALLQTFPSNYEFAPKEQPVKMREIGTLIGNAVPVKLGTIIADSIMKHLSSN